jgi:hypothetical protein
MLVFYLPIIIFEAIFESANNRTQSRARSNNS